MEKKPKYVCSFYNCKNNTNNKPNLKFFTFPRSKDLSKQWVTACRNVRLSNYTGSSLRTMCKVCAEHFTRDDYLFRYAPFQNRLNNSAVPKDLEGHIPELSCDIKADPNGVSTSNISSSENVIKEELISHYCEVSLAPVSPYSGRADHSPVATNHCEASGKFVEDISAKNKSRKTYNNESINSLVKIKATENENSANSVVINEEIIESQNSTNSVKIKEEIIESHNSINSVIIKEEIIEDETTFLPSLTEMQKKNKDISPVEEDEKKCMKNSTIFPLCFSKLKEQEDEGIANTTTFLQFDNYKIKIEDEDGT